MTVETASAPVKCVVWDLDSTLWDGTLLEDATVSADPAIVATIRELDRRGILNSIASRNDEAAALARLDDLGLRELFVSPQIHWGSKAASIARIREVLNIGIDSIVFVDDQPFEHDEVRFALPTVRCYLPGASAGLLALPAFTPKGITAEAGARRAMYQAQSARDADEQAWEGPPAAFLATLDLTLTVRPARASDLLRAEELTVRTHQLNTTGRSYSIEELTAQIASHDHDVLVAELTDRYGPYGIIGLALVAWEDQIARMPLFLTSCRVMSRGVGTVMLNDVLGRARRRGRDLCVEIVHNDRNRMMMVTLRLAGYAEAGTRDDAVLLRSTRDPDPVPEYFKVVSY